MNPDQVNLAVLTLAGALHVVVLALVVIARRLRR